METRTIGSLTVSVIGLGCNNFGRRLDSSGAAAVVNAALAAGITLFDTADIYGNGQSEEFLGRALGSRRREVIIATKFGNLMEGQGRGASPAYIRQAAEASLRRLGTDTIDLYQLHSPDPDVPIQDTLGALDELVKAGKVREIGCSNFSIDQLREAEKAVPTGAAHFVSIQNEYSLMNREPEHEILPECERAGIAFLPYFPLASGLLTGKYRKGQTLPQGTRISASSSYSKWLSEENLTLVEALIQFAESRGHSILDLAFAWLLARPAVASVIAGAMTPAQINANTAVTWRLTNADLAAIDGILQH
ncbi:MAG TPA: aldo/keto reductase [Aggregatilineales bacterium]|nr:aldo/keto reductase [Aggregatilineales bacterium]